MDCKEYGPWISRYVDEDLEGKELEIFLEHLSGCAACQREMAALERLRGMLKTADTLDGIPHIKGDWGLEDLLRQETALEAADGTEPFLPTVDPQATTKDRERTGEGGWSKRFLVPLPLPVQNVVRFAIPLLVIVVVATWFYTRKTRNWIDVRNIQPLPTATVAFPQEEGRDVDLFVIGHTTHQPWADYGDELPMIELASTPSR